MRAHLRIAGTTTFVAERCSNADFHDLTLMSAAATTFSPTAPSAGGGACSIAAPDSLVVAPQRSGSRSDRYPRPAAAGVGETSEISLARFTSASAAQAHDDAVQGRLKRGRAPPIHRMPCLAHAHADPHRTSR